MRKIILLFKVIIILLPAALFAQNKVVTGTVRDVGGALPGASVLEKGVSSNGTVTDVNGKFKLTLRGSSNTLIVRFIGYNDQEFKAGDGSIDIILASKSQSIEEVMVTGFGTKKRITNTGAASTISAATIRTVPTANVQNTLAGRLPGFFSQQSSGQPGKDASDFFIRGVSSLNPAGNQPLIIVDDIEYSYDQLQQINVNEIESITILKDASTTAIYGIKGANGVLVVSTRRGKSGSPKFNLRVESGVQSPTRTPKFLNSYETAQLINEAFLNDGLEGQFQFSQTDLDHFKNGTDKYNHPDVDWYNEIFKKNSVQTNSNLDISGGSEQVKYFISGGAMLQNGLNKDFSDPQNLVNTNYTFKRYNFRSNFDLKATKTMDIRVDVTTRFSDLNQPHELSSVGQIYDFKSQTPFSSPVLNPNGSYSYAYSRFNPTQLPTLNARLGTGGYDNSKRTDFNALLGVTQKLDDLTKGLSLTGRVAYSSIEQFTKSVSRSTIPSFHYNPDGTYIKNPNGTFFYSPYHQSASSDISITNLNLQLYANYDRTFNEDHHFTGL
ncbi:MAG: SusC/RagA family TonB-linked outer membrane protein, partial [Mucilaginibacter sp.]